MNEPDEKTKDSKPGHPEPLSQEPLAERRTGRERRKGIDRRSGFDRRRDMDRQISERKSMSEE